MELSPLSAVSPIDGRYGSKTAELRLVFSEYALIRYRVIVEVRWLQTLAAHPAIEELQPFGSSDNQVLEDIIEQFSEADAANVKDHEATTNHDVKAVEYFFAVQTRS